MDQKLRLGKRELNCLLLFTSNYVVSVGEVFSSFGCLGKSTLLTHLSQRLIGEPLDTHGPASVRRPSSSSSSSTMLKHLLLRTACPIKAKFYVKPLWIGGTKVCSRHPGHMTKMAATPIYGKNPSKPSSLELAGRFPRNLVCSIGDSARHSLFK